MQELYVRTLRRRLEASIEYQLIGARSPQRRLCRGQQDYCRSQIAFDTPRVKVLQKTAKTYTQELA